MGLIRAEITTPYQGSHGRCRGQRDDLLLRPPSCLFLRETCHMTGDHAEALSFNDDEALAPMDLASRAAPRSRESRPGAPVEAKVHPTFTDHARFRPSLADGELLLIGTGTSVLQ